MGILVGGPRAWRVQRAGDLMVSYQWVNGDQAMLLFPSRPRKGAGTYVVPLQAAWAYADSNTGAPTPYLIQQCAVAAEVMGLDQSRWTLKAIADAIVDGLPDLLAMPPEPDWSAIERQTQPPTEISLSVDGQTVVEREVR